MEARDRNVLCIIAATYLSLTFSLLFIFRWQMLGEHPGYEGHLSGREGGHWGLRLTLRCPLFPQDHTVELANSTPGLRGHACARGASARRGANLGRRLMCYDSNLCSGRRNTSVSSAGPSVIDIPLSLLSSNNLRWPVFTGASADLLCHRMCWRFSGSMNLHGGDGEGQPGHEMAPVLFWLPEFKARRITTKA